MKQAAYSQDDHKVRIDKWLWAARFFKTRSLASDAVVAGHVDLNGARPKPARDVKTGDMLKIRTDHGLFEVEVLGVSDKRGPAEVARALYAETADSVAKREEAALQKSMEPTFDHPQIKGRPTKKWRRQLHLQER
ncbi:RNA-binding S4 domain-containing protein [Amantichitinum ursilacus]|uniref:Heat shock protein 15 n=1 Tax=Amantichitinum ursilacus TaxID=857265 RepID=A0A0N0XMK1_9NEIS|nr:RNA-binding S4 domain-containing protein [Amantichitinum ursilacus]KPC54775.1 Heat shock protein 15 [Amantichitinum ursilacus]